MFPRDDHPLSGKQAPSPFGSRVMSRLDVVTNQVTTRRLLKGESAPWADGFHRVGGVSFLIWTTSLSERANGERA